MSVLFIGILVVVIVAVLFLRGFDKVANRDHQSQTKKIIKELQNK